MCICLCIYLCMIDFSLDTFIHAHKILYPYLSRFTSKFQSEFHFLAFPWSWQFIRDTSEENGLPWCCGVLRAAAPVPERSLLSTWDVSCLPSLHLISKEVHNALFPTLQPWRGKQEKKPSVQDHSRLYLAQFDLMRRNLGNKLLAPLRVGKKSTCPSMPDPALSKPTNPLLESSKAIILEDRPDSRQSVLSIFRHFHKALG